MTVRRGRARSDAWAEVPHRIRHALRGVPGRERAEFIPAVVVPQGSPPGWRSALRSERVLTDAPCLPVADLDRVGAW